MSVEVMAAAWALGSKKDPRRIDPTDKYVLLAIADSANDDGRHSYNGEKTLATKTSLDVRTVRYAIRHLKHHRAISVEVRGSEKGTNLYTVHLDRYEPCREGRSRCLGIGKRAGVRQQIPHPPPAGGEATDSSPRGKRFLTGEATDSSNPSEDPSLNHPPNPPSRKRDRVPNLATVEVAQVFDAWRASTGKRRAQLDPKRRKLITAALDLGYTVDELCLAVTGWERSPHHRGENDRKTVYNDLGLLLRDADRIDCFLAFAQGTGTRRASSGGGSLPSHGDNAGHDDDAANCRSCGTGRYRRRPGDSGVDNVAADG
jgi:hypothetical protein